MAGYLWNAQNLSKSRILQWRIDGCRGCLSRGEPRGGGFNFRNLVARTLVFRQTKHVEHYADCNCTGFVLERLQSDQESSFKIYITFSTKIISTCEKNPLPVQVLSKELSSPRHWSAAVACCKTKEQILH